jgi:flagellar basal-body rod protein FlgG
MQEGMFIAASGALRQERKLEVIANNLANLNNVGFKRDSLTFESMMPPFQNDLSFEASRNVLLPAERSNLNVAYVGVAGFSTEFSQGILDQTHNTFDLALEGDGFFAVQTPDGVRYTRKGNFHLDDRKRIVSQNGFPVQGPQGGEIALPNFNGELTVDIDGNISGGRGINIIPLGQIKVVRFDDSTSLEKQGDGLFQSTDLNQKEKKAPNTKIRQGYLEQSNVKNVEEMVHMINAVRSFETYQKVIQTIDQLDERAANTIGRIG